MSDPKSGSCYTVPCGQCMACRVNRTAEWQLRLVMESRSHLDNCFVTLTYCDEFLPKNNSLVKRHAQLFLKRLRKRVGSFRYFMCGEYGNKGFRGINPHYHALLFGVSIFQENIINDCWTDVVTRKSIGNVHMGTCTGQSARYTARYVQKKLMGNRRIEYSLRRLVPEFSLMSRRPGIGFYQWEKYKNFWLNNGFIVLDGKKVPIPRSWLRLLSDSDRIKYRQRRIEEAQDRKEVKLDKLEGLDWLLGQREVDSRKQRDRNINKILSMKGCEKL